MTDVTQRGWMGVRREIRRSGMYAVSFAAFLFTLPAGAALVPGIPFGFGFAPGLGAQNGFASSRVITSGEVSVIFLPPDGVSAPLGFSDGFSLTSNDFTRDGVTESKVAFVDGGGINPNARAEAQGTSQPGVLKASAKSRIAGGVSSATSRVFVDFIDMLQIDENGNLASDFDVQLAISGGLHSSPPITGSAFAFAQLWIFSFEDVARLPSPFAPIDARYYTQFFESTSGETRHFEVGSLDGLEPGSKFWIYAHLQVFAHARGDFPFANTFSGDYAANFGNTVQLFIDPDPANPGAMYSSASGQSYLTAVPLPPSFVLVSGATFVLLASGRVRQRRDPSASGTNFARDK